MIKKVLLTSSNNKGSKVILQPGDMLVYKGMILEHWRETICWTRLHSSVFTL